MRPTRGFIPRIVIEPREKILRTAFAVLRTFGGPGQPYPPIWPCSTRGLPCLRCCHRSGGLLLHRFTLACAALEQARKRFCLQPAAECNLHRRFAFCGTFRGRILANPTPWRYQARRPSVPKRRSPDFPPARIALRRLHQRSPAPPAGFHYKGKGHVKSSEFPAGRHSCMCGMSHIANVNGRRTTALAVARGARGAYHFGQ